MKIVFIFGSGAVGKMTVGQKLMEETGLRLFHNHHLIEPIMEVFGFFNGEALKRTREVFYEEFLKTDNKGLIMTLMMAFNSKEDWAYLEHVLEVFKDHEHYCIELTADQKVRLERNSTENRLMHKPSKRNQEFSVKRILYEDSKYRLVSEEGELPFKNYIRIDNTNLSPEAVVGIVKERFPKLF